MTTSKVNVSECVIKRSAESVRESGGASRITLVNGMATFKPWPFYPEIEPPDTEPLWTLRKRSVFLSWVSKPAFPTSHFTI